jgi:cytosolic 5'-nucleotidase 3
MDVHIHNLELYEKKLQTLKEHGYDSLHIVADFDKTLTKGFVEGQKAHTSPAQIREGGYLSEEYVEKSFALADKYGPIERNPTIPFDEKIAAMVEWWQLHLELMIEHGMHRGVIEDIIKKKKIHAREGLQEFIMLAHKHQVPLLIFSAGLGDIITEFLKSEGMLHPNMHIISNFYDYDHSGKVKGYKSTIIHSLNKKEVEVKHLPYAQEVKSRRNVLLLGDSIGDIEMSEGFSHDTILRIGFLNRDVDRLEEFSRAFDVVITEDTGLHFVNELLKQIKH